MGVEINLVLLFSSSSRLHNNINSRQAKKKVVGTPSDHRHCVDVVLHVKCLIERHIRKRERERNGVGDGKFLSLSLSVK